MPCFSTKKSLVFITDNYSLTHLRIYLPLVITSAKLLFKKILDVISEYMSVLCCECVNVMQRGYLVLEHVGKWGKCVMLVVVVGEGLVSRSDRKCLHRWKSNADTVRTVYRKQPPLQLFVSIYMCAPD